MGRSQTETRAVGLQNLPLAQSQCTTQENGIIRHSPVSEVKPGGLLARASGLLQQLFADGETSKAWSTTILYS